MESDLRLLKLYRKAVHDHDVVDTDCSNVLSLATDYFDAIEIQKVPFENAFHDMFGTVDDLQITKFDVSMQSYPLFCSSETIEKHKEDKNYSNPFEVGNDGYPYLSIIHIHITPETFYRIQICDSHNSLKTMQRLSEDLHNVLADYTIVSNRDFLYRIYQTISVGDFAIVIKSKEADVPFCVSTSIRKRRMVSNPIDIEQFFPTNIVLYKTYTILSIYNTLIKGDISSKAMAEADDNRFVLRCCYSNKYWAHRSSTENTDLIKCEQRINDKLRRLNGRYDFSVDLSDIRFRAVLRDLMHYKLDVTISGGIDAFHTSESEEFDEADYLHFLLQNGYLSHVNERYVFKFTDLMDDVSSDAYGISASILPNPLEFMEQINERIIEDAFTRFNKASKSVIDIQNKGYCKNLHYNMLLVKRLICLCDTMTKQSKMP